MKLCTYVVCPSVRLYVCLYVCLPTCLYVCLSASLLCFHNSKSYSYLSPSIEKLPFCRYIFPSFAMSVCLPVCLSVLSFVSQYRLLFLPAGLSVCLSLCCTIPALICTSLTRTSYLYEVPYGANIMWICGPCRLCILFIVKICSAVTYNTNIYFLYIT